MIFRCIRYLSGQLPQRSPTSNDGIILERTATIDASPPKRPQFSLGGCSRDDSIPTPPESATPTQAWLQVLVNHLVMMISFGLIQSFGIFQLPYEEMLSSSPSNVAWIGSVHIFIVYLLGTFSGWALDRGYYKRCLFAGSCFQIIGLIAAGFSKGYWKTFIFHGVFQGIGHGLMFCPAVTVTAKYFEGSKSRMTALGIAGCGASTGGILFPLIAKYTIISLGVGKTLWIISGVVSFLSILILLLAHSGVKRKPSSASTSTTGSNTKMAFVEWRAFTDPSYALYTASMFFTFLGLWIPFFYVREFGATALQIPKSMSFIILIVLNAAGIPGRIVPALLADRCIGTINTYILTLVLTSATLLCWPLVETRTSMTPWSIAYGFCAGGASSLLQAGLTSLNNEPHKTGIKIGMAFSVVGFASLVGGPVGGVLIRAGQQTRRKGTDAYVWMMVFTGIIVLLGCGILCLARVAKKGYKLKVKV
ncbi:major facilitator superfamily domain-containing protein [Ampelomyces quisqualis]|uniref:Major facilitator superfamily domain-containing protein n=1 Tax=Ampelomyces quisqualis TaxID=50730 RepID=A0A6A5QHS0_AMPQU|nr:major facilitator superfamily domain-containing protein [Ampelomyces quisqualis]